MFARADEADVLDQRAELIAGGNAVQANAVIFGFLAVAHDGDGRNFVDAVGLGHFAVLDEVAHLHADLIGERRHFLGEFSRLGAHLTFERAALALCKDNQPHRRRQVGQHFTHLIF